MSPTVRRWALRALQLAVVGFVLWRATRSLAGQWSEFRARSAGLHPDWGRIALSALVVLATYALLVQSWRTLVRAWGSQLGFVDACRIWAVSNLGRYLPGKAVWTIAAMGLLARRAGVSPVAASGSAVVGTLVNIAASFAVVLVAGTGAVEAMLPGSRTAGVVLGVLVTLGLIALPLLLPPLVAIAARLTRRRVELTPVPARTLWLVVLSNVLAWVGYGVAFRLLALALFPGSAGNWLQYLAVFTGSYLVGYLAIVVPAGAGVREVVMVAGLTGLGLASNVDAVVLALASRLWLTALELAPGLLFLARDATLRTSVSLPPDVPS